MWLKMRFGAEGQEPWQFLWLPHGVGKPQGQHLDGEHGHKQAFGNVLSGEMASLGVEPKRSGMKAGGHGTRAAG